MKLKWALRGLIVLTAVLLVAVLWLRVQQNRPGELPALGKVPDFKLVEASGRPLTLADLNGQVWIAAFIFTRCAGICPVMSTQMSRLPAGNYRLVSFSVDPDHDTPAVLTEYAARYHADRTRWFFVTGEKSALRRLATEGFHVPAEDATAADSEPILHSAHLVLVDRVGQIRGYYDGTNSDDVHRLLADARRL